MNKSTTNVNRFTQWEWTDVRPAMQEHKRVVIAKGRGRMFGGTVKAELISNDGENAHSVRLTALCKCGKSAFHDLRSLNGVVRCTDGHPLYFGKSMVSDAHAKWLGSTIELGDEFRALCGDLFDVWTIWADCAPDDKLARMRAAEFERYVVTTVSKHGYRLDNYRSATL